ncbi:hypothetical protein H0H93_010057, partial [Arthromyces matolae]
VDPSWGQARLLNMVYGLRPSYAEFSAEMKTIMMANESFGQYRSGFPKGKLGEGVDIYVL